MGLEDLKYLKLREIKPKNAFWTGWIYSDMIRLQIHIFQNLNVTIDQLFSTSDQFGEPSISYLETKYYTS